MNTQLILFPQVFNGAYNTVSQPVISEYVSNSSFNNQISSGLITAQASGNMMTFMQTNANPLAYAFEAIVTNNTSLVTNVPAGLQIQVDATNTLVMLTQKISNLSATTNYDLKITSKVSNASNPVLVHVGTANGFYGSVSNNATTLGSFTTLFTVSSTTFSTQTFIVSPASADEILVLFFEPVNPTASIITIEEISVKETLSNAPVVFTDVENGQVICDLYEDEEIPLNLSVDEFKNVAEQTKSYSKDFKLPSTKRNNKIFNEIFEVTRVSIDDTFALNPFVFNPYIKTRAILKNDSFTVFDGFMKLNDIVDNDGEISYNINLYSETVSLKDSTESKKISDLDFSELDHVYKVDNIKESWSGGLVLNNPLPVFTKAGTVGDDTTDVLKYPFCDWSGNLSVSATGNLNSNIHLNRLEDAFRPFIKCKYIIDNIFRDAGFTFSSDFLNSTRFTKLYMDFNFGGEGGFNVASNDASAMHHTGLTNFAGTSDTKIQFNTFGTYSNPSFGGINAQNYLDLTNNRFTALFNNSNVEVRYKIDIFNDTITSKKGVAKIKHFNSSNVLLNTLEQKTYTINGSIFTDPKYTYNGIVNVVMNAGDYLEFYFKSRDGASDIRQQETLSEGSTIALFFSSSEGVSMKSLLNKIRGDIGQWEFITALRKLFNLIFIEDKQNPNNIIIEPYNDVFIDSSNTSTINAVQHRWDDKVDITQIKLKPLSDLNRRTEFSYADDDDNYPLNIYKNSSGGYLYGTYNFTVPNYTLLKGTDKISAEPFAPTICKPVLDGFDPILTVPVIYQESDSGFSAYDNAPRILFDCGIATLTTGTYSSSAQNHTSLFSNETEFLQFSHVNQIPVTIDTDDYNYGNEVGYFSQLGGNPVNNLYNEYWSSYYDELYHPDTRILELKVNLTSADIQNFNFYDTVMIKNREFRVNKIQYKPNELSLVEFILIS